MMSSEDAVPAPRFEAVSEAYAWLESHINYERNLGSLKYGAETFELDSFRRLMNSLGNPQRTGKSIHIAGTRGKGSTALMLESVLRSRGYRVATYNSPHIREFRERIRIDGAPISGEGFCRALEIAAKARARIRDGERDGERDNERGPECDRERDDAFSFKTVFELLTAAYFVAARESNADWLVVETGLGGRLDATNILDPGPVALTRIALEHTHLLGETMGEIAAEKAAILKSGGWAVAGRQAPGRGAGRLDGAAHEVFRRRAEECGARLDRSEQRCPLIEERYHPEGMDLKFDFAGQELALSLEIYGPFIAENLQTCLATIERLAEEGSIELPDASAIQTALSQLRLPGRMQRIDVEGPNPGVLFIDSAHCAAGAEAVSDALARHFPGGSAWGVVAMTEDKAHGRFFEELARWPGWRGIVCSEVPNPRSLGAAKLADAASAHFKEVSVAIDLETALQFAAEKVEKDDMIVSAGSIFGIAGALDWAARNGQRTSSPENTT